MPSRFRTLAVTLPLILGVGCAHSSPPAARDTEYLVTVSAGEFPRHGTPVTFTLPDEFSARALQLVDHSGRAVPLQASAGEATIIVDDLPAGTKRQYRLREAAWSGPQVEADHEDGAVTVSVAGRPVFRYNAEPTPLPSPDVDPVFRRGGYIHPVRTPSGKVVTGDYPPDHRHHHGIWAAWTNTVFEGRTPDFWNMGQQRGTVRPLALDSVWSGAVHGGISARHRYIDLTGDVPEDVLLERWTTRVYTAPAAAQLYYLFDLELEQTTASLSPLHLPQYRYGGVGFRGPDEWNGEANAFLSHLRGAGSL
jgi:hypothetical protein